ncbi:helix-turn-helix domain-containing protein [Paracoccus fontiphilus]|uniref:Helix-turn-helix domain-containing protein n=1 Tax=Paracoccus fontiphilus TaxID=1815556 RepID=A0ABV7IIS3_9RHOB|nr:helix-turn-helix domain-containing protein [Paracoccus fontiphilus]
MVNLSLREAVKHFDVSRPTLQKALKSGKISGVQDGQGHWTIDPSEIARLYKPRSKEPVKDPTQDAPSDNSYSKEIAHLKAQLAEAEQRAAVAEALAEEREKHINDLRRILPAPKPVKKPWWPWSK